MQEFDLEISRLSIFDRALSLSLLSYICISIFLNYANLKGRPTFSCIEAQICRKINLKIPVWMVQRKLKEEASWTLEWSLRLKIVNIAFDSHRQKKQNILTELFKCFPHGPFPTVPYMIVQFYLSIHLYWGELWYPIEKW